MIIVIIRGWIHTLSRTYTHTQSNLLNKRNIKEPGTGRCVSGLHGVKIVKHQLVCDTILHKLTAAAGHYDNTTTT